MTLIVKRQEYKVVEDMMKLIAIDATRCRYNSVGVSCL